MNRMKTAASIFGAAALTVSLAACGGDDDFCDTVESELGDTSMSGVSAAMTDPGSAGDLVSSFRTVADAASGDIADDWNAMADAFEALSDIDVNDPESMADLDESMFSDMDNVGQRISDHLMEECA